MCPMLTQDFKTHYTILGIRYPLCSQDKYPQCGRDCRKSKARATLTRRILKMSLSSLASVGRAGLIRKGVASAGRCASPRIHHHSPRGHIHKSKHKIGPRGVPPISICVEGRFFIGSNDCDSHLVITHLLQSDVYMFLFETM